MVKRRARHDAVKLNPFQRVMALWEEEGPYNAATVFQFSGRADSGALQDAIQLSCRDAGLGRFVLDREGETYWYEPVDTIRLDQIRSGNPISETLCRVLAEQMNEPFPHEPHHPIRWTLVEDTQTDTNFLALVWRHIAADAVSIRLLARHVLARYYGASEIPSKGSLRVHPPDYGRVMKPHRRRLGYLGPLVRSIRLYLRLRRVYRLPERKGHGKATRVLLFDTPEDLLPRLTEACRARQVSVNDAFLAALASAIAEMTPSRQVQSRRRSLALASAVDVRRAAAEDLSDCFGLFVGRWVTLIDHRDLTDFEGVLNEVARQTRVEKAEKRFAGPEWDFLTLLLLRRWLSVNEDRRWYRKVYPLTAGVSNIRMSASEFPGSEGKLLGCFLVPPTGPALPLVVSPATLGDTLKFSAIYQEASLSDSQVRTLMDLFLSKLEQFSKTQGH